MLEFLFFSSAPAHIRRFRSRENHSVWIEFPALSTCSVTFCMLHDDRRRLIVSREGAKHETTIAFGQSFDTRAMGIQALAKIGEHSLLVGEGIFSHLNGLIVVLGPV